MRIEHKSQGPILQPAPAQAPHTAPSASYPRWSAGDIYRFGRFSALSFSLMLPLLGAGTVSREIPAARLAGLTLVAVAFHLFAYVLNDVVDLPIDRSEPLRADSPLVRGMLRPVDATVFAVLQVPFAFAVHFWMQGRAAAGTLLVAALALMAVYDLYSKRLVIPMVSDAVQGLGWVCLALYGASISEWAPSSLTWVLACLAFLYVLMINGVHGGLRDLVNDRKCGARTTAIFFGAGAGRGGGVLVPASLIIYALVLQALLLALTLLCLARNWPRYERPAWHATLWIVLAAHAALIALVQLARRAAGSRPELIRAGMLHLVLSLGLLFFPFALYLDRPAAIAVLLAYVIPVAVMWLHDGLRWG